MKKGVIYWLRWVAVLPGSIIIGFLLTFPLHWILVTVYAINGGTDVGSLAFFVQFFSGNFSIETLERTIYPAVIATGFIIGGYKIAPKHKFKTSLTLFGIYVSLWFIASFIALTIGNINNELFLQFSPIRSFLALSGVVVGLLVTRGMDKKNK